MNFQVKLKFFRSLILLMAPYLLWVWMSRDFISGKIFIGQDNWYYYHWITYHFEHLINGVYPQWNPFHSWGIYDYIPTRLIGDFNPFLLIIPVLMTLGVSPAGAYLTFIFIYFWVVLLGFYFLLYLICSEKHIALLGYVILMFSSVFGVHSFFQLEVLTITAPIIWFYVFCLLFSRAQTAGQLRHSSLGMAFALIIGLTSYVPFFFLIVGTCIFLSVLIWNPKEISGIGLNIYKFLRYQPVKAILIAFLLLLALYPGLQCKNNIRDSQNIFLFDRSDPNLKREDNVSLKAINEGALFTQASIGELFSDFSTGEQHSVFVSNIIFLLALIFVFNCSNRKQASILTAGFLLFMISIGEVSGWHKFLYDNIFLFRLCRNYLFFWPILIGIIIIFIMNELKIFLLTDFSSPSKRLFYGFWIIVVHGGFTTYLLTLENVPFTSFLTVLLNAAWFLAGIFSNIIKKNNKLFIFGLTLIALIQPLNVLKYFRDFDSTNSFSREHTRYPMAFEYERPLLDLKDQSVDCYYYNPKMRKDDSGFCSSRYYGQRYSYELKNHVSPDILKEYVRYKFVLYKSTRWMDFSNPNWNLLEQNLSKDGMKEALVDSIQGQQEGEKGAFFISNPNKILRVNRFEANQVEIITNFNEKIFLVYNDSYQSKWKAFIDGKPRRIYRANYAFKGIWIDPGLHKVEFVFGSTFEQGYYFFLIFIMLVLLIVVVVGFISKTRNEFYG